MIQDPKAWPSFSMELWDVALLQKRFSDFNISHIPREQNRTADGLAGIADTFHHSLIFDGCSIPVRILRPPLV